MKEDKKKNRHSNGKSGKRWFCIFTVLTLLITVPSYRGFSLLSILLGTEEVYAAAADEAQEQLDSVNDTLDTLEDSSDALSSQIRQVQAELDSMLTSMESIQQQIKDRQDAIDQCAEDLDQAEENADREYQSMKLRIQYMYENSSVSSFWDAVFESDGFADMLNRIEYVATMYRSDRELLTSYQDAVNEITDLQSQLTSDMTDLQTMEDKYIQQKADLETKIASLEAQKEDYQDEMERYLTLAEQYEETITSLGGTVQEAEEAAERRAALDEARAGESKNKEVYGNYNPDPATNVSGDAIVAYALQFVGNPYVWGGDSLTEGCDCSGFIHLVYAHFGISTPRYSQAFLEDGQIVSYQYLQPGDVVIYPGHCAIYMSNGKIVEAQGKAFGITDDRSVNCHTITGIRRYV